MTNAFADRGKILRRLQPMNGYLDTIHRLVQHSDFLKH